MTVNTTTGEIVDDWMNTNADGQVANTLDELEGTIEQGLHTFIEVGQALAEIRDRRLYRNDFETFEDYCADRWHMSRSVAYDTIAAADAVNALSAIADTPTPANVGQARELSGLTADDAAETMRVADDATAGKITAQAIRDARLSILENLSAKYVEQFPALDYFERRGEHQRVNALGRDLAAMDSDEQARRLEILDKTIAYEKRKESGEAPRHLQVVSGSTAPATEDPAPSPHASNPDADDLIEAVGRVTRLLCVVEASEVRSSHYPMFFDAGLMLAQFADNLKES